MRSIFTFTIAILILTACSQTPIPATSTPLPSITPTHISTVTPTVLPTFTPTLPTSDLTPEQLAELDKTVKLLDGAYTIDTYKDGDKTYAKFTDAKTGETIPEIRIDANDPEQLSWSKVYEYRDHTIVIPQAMDKITMDSDGQVHFDFPGYEWKDGKFERKMIEGQPVLNNIETQVDTILDGDSSYVILTETELNESEIVETGNGLYLVGNDLRIQLDGKYVRGDSFPMRNESTELWDIVPVSGYQIYNSLDSKYPVSVIFYMDKNGKLNFKLIDNPNITIDIDF